MVQPKRKAKLTTQKEILITTASNTRSLGRPKPLPVEVLSENVNIFLGQIGDVLDKAPQNIQHFHLDEISVTVEVSAKGELSLLGSGVGVEGKGGLSFVFKRG